MSQIEKVDAIIIGGGIIGLATAKGLSQHGLRVALVEHKALEPFLLDEKPSLRATAINTASERFFKQLGVWDSILSTKRAQSYTSIHVWEHHGIAKLNVHANDYGYDNLGHIIENTAIYNALLNACQKQDNIRFYSSVTVDNITREDYETCVHLSNQQIITGQLIVGADGARSWVRDQADIPFIQHDYKHAALMTTIKTEKPHQCCAIQAFYDKGIIAFLPLSDPHLSCLVWSMHPTTANHYKRIDAKQFEQQLETLFEHHLGQCSIVNIREVFPLTARYAHQFAKHRLVLVGDAAHSIHPLAGQGMNLGLMDVKFLVEEIGTLFLQGNDIGLKDNLRTYDKKRKKHAIAMLAAMQCIQDSFNGSNTIKKVTRGLIMNTVNYVPFIKKTILKHAMGI